MLFSIHSTVKPAWAPLAPDFTDRRTEAGLADICFTVGVSRSWASDWVASTATPRTADMRILPIPNFMGTPSARSGDDGTYACRNGDAASRGSANMRLQGCFESRHLRCNPTSRSTDV